MDQKHQFAGLNEALDTVDAALAQADANTLTGSEPTKVLNRVKDTERRLAAFRTAVVTRATETNAWLGKARSPEEWVADTCGTTLADAKRTIETGEQLAALPHVDEAFSAGDVSEAQARQIASIGDGAKGHEDELVREAQHGTHRQLKDRCDRLAAASRSRQDEARRLKRQQARRSGRWYRNNDDAQVLEVAFGPEQGVLARAHVEAETDALFRIARAEGRREPRHAYVADAAANLLAGRTVDGTPLPTKTAPALVDTEADGVQTGTDGLTTTGQPGRHLRCQPTVTFICDINSFRNGQVPDGGRCEIDGVGPVPVELVERFLGDAFVKAVIADGTDIRTVAHYGRNIPTYLETALNLRDPHCSVPGCDSRLGLEYTHNDIDHADGGPVSYANIRRKCGYHHDQETNHGHTLMTSERGTTWRDADGQAVSREPTTQLQLE